MKKILFMLFLGLFLINTTSAYADSEQEIVRQAKERTNRTEENCKKLAWTGKEYTTSDIMNSADKEYTCLKNAVNREIKKAFDPKTQMAVANQLNIFRAKYHEYYSNYYLNNKYCTPNCGSMAPQLVKGKLMSFELQILEDLIFLNTGKMAY